MEQQSTSEIKQSIPKKAEEGSSANTQNVEEEVEEDETYAFRLFAQPLPTTGVTNTTGDTSDATGSLNTKIEAVTRIRLRSNSPSQVEDAPHATSKKRKRSLSYYIRPEISDHVKDQFRASAVRGEDILNRSAEPELSAGLRCPWRVIAASESALTSAVAASYIVDDLDESRTKCQNTKLMFEPESGGGKEPIVSKHQNLTDASEAEEKQIALARPEIESMNAQTQMKSQNSLKKRGRKGKKSRIKIRVRMRAVEAKKAEMHAKSLAKKEEEEAKAKEKEEYLRLKKTKMNRAKQLKKREKKRLEKDEIGSMESPS